ncbi:tyrosine-protein phosphatase [Pseudidiomarina sediminum]|uniref:tyrosine-protein phosphatase n=1 Tax=Pseudidiomarina sediminum TaxID=431675 RepID=UPI001C983A4F|nr:tyrosine-protein phosphatase [Pseudidiomarina sediminum]MBY6063695.1 tyrosine-protein phosphatase [Pseudidiomarina sediminum]
MKFKLTHLAFALLSTSLVAGGTLAHASTEAPQTDVGVESVSSSERLIPLEGGRNFRDLGGYTTTDGRTVKRGKIFRSGVLNGLTDEDYTIIDGLNIGTVVDFRTTEERQTEVTQWRASPVEHISTDYAMDFAREEFARIFADPNVSAADIEHAMAEMYPTILDSQLENYKQMFARLLQKDEGLLFHCTAGKDRTGISALLILTALGVDKETAIADYMASNDYLDFDAMLPKKGEQQDGPHAEMMALFARLPEDVLQPLMGVKRSMIVAAIDEMEREHGSIIGYIHNELDVSQQDIAVLRSKYLD